MKKEKKVEQPEQFKIGRTELGELARLTGYKVKMRTPATMKVIKSFLRTIRLEIERGNEVVLPTIGVLKLKIQEPRYIESGVLKDESIYVHYRYKVVLHPSITLKKRLKNASKKRFVEC